MYSQGDLEEAVAAGALAPEQAHNLRNFVATRNGAPTADEEYARVFLGFNDAFVGYACLFALLALGMIGATVGDSSRGFGGVPSMGLLVGGALVAGGSWGLSELFLRRGRFAYPGIIMALTLGVGTFVALAGLITMVFDRSPPDEVVGGLLGFFAAGAAAALSWLYWRRFKVPFAAFVFVGMAVVGVIVLILGLTARTGAAGTILPIVVTIAGLAVFAYAMVWDGRDPMRFTARSELGLWLHLLAAILIVIGLTRLLGLTNIDSVGQAIGMIALYLVLALVALIVNRRALLLIGIGPLIASIALFFNEGSHSRRRYDMDDYDTDRFSSSGGGMDSFGGGYGHSNGSDMLLSSTTTLVIISIILLLLAIFWRPLRRGLVSILPAGLRARVPAADQAMAPQAQTFE